MEGSIVSAGAGLPLLRELGEALDRDEYPQVGQNGLVMPGTSRFPFPPGEGVESHDAGAEAGSEGPAARQGQGAAGGRSAPAGAQALVLGQPGLSEELRHDLGVVAAAYPSLRVKVTPPVVWLLTHHRPINGLPAGAYVLTCAALDPAGLLHGRQTTVASWAWWDVGIWVGPRHTNWGDGSICSFEPRHGTWVPGDPLTRVLDLHSVWVARHLFLGHFGRWPGDQVVHTAHERVTEHLPGELCGCGSFRRYEDCHRGADLVLTGYARSRIFHSCVPNPVRRPPSEVLEMLREMLRLPR